MNILPGNHIFPTIEYSVRQSARAQRASLRIMPGGGLELVLPLHYSLKEVPRLMSHFLPWISKNKHRCFQSPKVTPLYLPYFFSLYGKSAYFIAAQIQKKLQVVRLGDILEKQVYHKQSSSSIKPSIHLPKIKGKLQHKLILWLKHIAQNELGAMLSNLAKDYEFQYTSCTIRLQKTRWGSCSRKGAINLNAKLLFLPTPLIRYVLLHELCHLKYFNHGADFWNLLIALEPQAKAYRKQLCDAWKYIPDWC